MPEASLHVMMSNCAQRAIMSNRGELRRKRGHRRRSPRTRHTGLRTGFACAPKKAFPCRSTFYISFRSRMGRVRFCRPFLPKAFGAGRGTSGNSHTITLIADAVGPIGHIGSGIRPPVRFSPFCRPTQVRRPLKGLPLLAIVLSHG